MTEQKPVRYDAFKAKAEKLLDSPVRLQKMLTQATQKLAAQGSDGIKEAKDDLQTALALIKAWISGDYRDVSNKTLVAVVAAVVYFVVPLDVIPDFILGWGLIDDIAVVGYVFSQVQEEINAFRQWQRGDPQIGDPQVGELQIGDPPLEDEKLGLDAAESDPENPER
ncbi:MAG: DUF1232 domain-containing protein [Pseudomonadales bacterium]|nr:DUF1232 domain-containing protein [Pseudomonadales bacterium]